VTAGPGGSGLRAGLRIGIVGGGQLGRMLALSAYPLGLRCRFLDPSPECPAGQVGELVVGAYDDPAALDRFADGVDVVTFEFENVPASALARLESRAAVWPPARALETGQDRLREKELFAASGIETAAFEAIDTLDDAVRAFGGLGGPCIIKTRRLGYDGKGQARINEAGQIAAAWPGLERASGGGGLIIERVVRFDSEVSIIATRGRDGSMAIYPPTENVHQHEPAAGGGILRRSLAPAPGISDEQVRLAGEAISRVMEGLGYVGTMAIEFFRVPDGRGGHTLVANETAPRVHNSGHWTMDGCGCSQFENHMRAVAGLPLGSPRAAGCSVMLNIVSTMPDVRALCRIDGLRIHLYGKEARPGRKLGHATLVGSSFDEIRDRLAAAERLIYPAG
jgi:5-(carboxyamino)imidazole ribonucleotide synthase